MGTYDRPDADTTRSTYLRAWDDGYKAADIGEPPSMGGLYRGEETYYIDGYNKFQTENDGQIWRLAADPHGVPIPVPDEASGMDGLHGVKRKTPEGEVRTTSSTGGQKGVKPERYSLVPVEALASVARLYAFGAVKYAAHNWRLGYEWSKSYDSLFRHANASMAGEDYDEETGEPHLAGVVFHAFTLMCYLFDMERYGKFDDRYKPDAVKEPITTEELAERLRIKQIIVTPPAARSSADIYRQTKNLIQGQSTGATAEQLMQEYQGVVQTPVDQMIDYLAGMYENWSIQTSRELRRVAQDLRNDKDRNVKSFVEFHEQFPISGLTGLEKMSFVGTKLVEIEPVRPMLDIRSMMLTIPTVVGAVYYYNDKHVVGSFQVRSRTDVTAVALPGYRFATNMDTMWTYVA